MALLDFLKKKEEAQKTKKEAPKPAEKKVEKASVAAKTEKPAAEKKQVTTSRTFSYDVVVAPHISEKATNLNEQNQYVFRVQPQANKPEIKKAIEGIYGVDVLAVNVVHIPKKKRRLGQTQGFKKGYRKAIVTIKEGQKIEIF